MRHGLRRRAIACAGIWLLALNAVVPLAAAWLSVGTADTNGDGRPDLWRYFDRSGRLVRVVVDDNYDGRPDATYDFDPVLGTRVRSEVDLDHDGQPDEVTLFRDGRVVARSAGVRGHGPALVPVHRFLHEILGPALPVAVASGAPSSATALPSAPLHTAVRQRRGTPDLLASAPRGPPPVPA